MRPENQLIKEIMKKENCSRATAFRRLRKAQSAQKQSILVSELSQNDTLNGQNDTKLIPSTPKSEINEYIPNWKRNQFKTKEDAYAHILDCLKKNLKKNKIIKGTVIYWRGHMMPV